MFLIAAKLHGQSPISPGNNICNCANLIVVKIRVAACD